jgi:hypothetical protein
MGSEAARPERAPSATDGQQGVKSNGSWPALAGAIPEPPSYSWRRWEWPHWASRRGLRVASTDDHCWRQRRGRLRRTREVPTTYPPLVSRASPSASPNKFTHSMIRKRAKPGNNISQGADDK